MLDSQDILFGITGQSLYFDPPEGRPSSVVSVDVFEDINGDDNTAEFTPSGSVETNPNTTLDAAAGPDEADPTKIPVAATTGIARKRLLLLTSAVNGEREWIDVERFVSADAVYARSPLLNTYATSDTLQSTRITATVNATWVADENKLSTPTRTTPRYRVRWIYVVSSVTYTAYTFIDLVRAPWRHGVVAPHVEAYSPGWMSRLSTDDRRNQGERVVDEAARQVKEDLRTRGLADYSQRNSEFVNGLVVRKAVFVGLHANYLHGAVSPDFMARAEADYWSFLDKAIRETVTQATPDGAGSPTPVLDLFER